MCIRAMGYDVEQALVALISTRRREVLNIALNSDRAFHNGKFGSTAEALVNAELESIKKLLQQQDHLLLMAKVTAPTGRLRVHTCS
jgi:hypothetical protein